MHTPSRIAPRLAGAVLAAVLLLSAGAAAARADAPAGWSAVPLASGDDSFSIKRFMSGLNRRERVVQLCVGTMCLALFILCKKFGGDGSTGAGRPGKAR